MIIYDADITGSLKVNGSDFNLTSISSSIVTNSSSIASLELVSGSYANSASFASDISTNSASIASLEKVSGSYANSASFASSISANSSSIGSLNSVSGSYANSASFASNISTNSASIGSLNAVSSSYLLNTTDTLTGDLTVTGNIIATTLNVQDVTASVVYSSGSNIFGSSSIDTQQFTGSILTSGSIEVNGDKFTVSGATGNTVVGGTLNSGAITSTGAGTFAGDVETDAGGQTAVGYQALYTSNGNGNVGMGQQAGYSISTGTFNIVIGHECGYGLTGGNNNVLIGDRAGRVLASGVDNVFIGTQAAYNRTGGNENTFVGEKANGIGIGTGNNNTGLGRFVGYKLTSGTKNTFIGHQSGLEATTADNSTFVGKNAGSLVTTGDNNTFIGEEAGSNVTIGDNNVCLGKDSATPSNSSTNTIVLGNSLIQSLQCQVQNISGLSDERDKTNIKNSEYGLDLINSLRPVTFEWNQRDGKKIGKKDLGFIAQDLQKIDDKHLSLVNDENPEKLLASYGRLIPVLVKSIQELKAEIEILKNK